MSRDRNPITLQHGLDIEEFDVPVRDNWPVLVRTYRPSNSKAIPLPLFIYLHGGGYVTGGLETDDTYCRSLASALLVMILSVEYRLAPENKFPVGFGDAGDIVRWAATPEAQSKLHVDLTKGFILGGTSAGANFTAGISHLAVQEGLTPPLTGLVFLAPSVCHPDARPEKYKDSIRSVDEINDAPGFTRKSIDYFAGEYLRTISTLE
jgi:acetyl esterase/lipase